MGVDIAQAQAGQALVEMAVMLPLLLLLAFGVYELGRGFHAYITVIHAAREGARVAMDGATTDAQIVAVAKAAASPLQLSDVTVSRTSSQTTVQVTYKFQANVTLVGALIGGGSGTLDIRRAMVSRAG